MSNLVSKHGGVFWLIFAALIFSTNSSCVVKSIAANTYRKHVREAPFDAVIIPGNPYEPNNLSLIFKARVLWAKALFEKGIAKNIIFSGAAVHTPYREALAMKMIAQRMGIPCEHVFVETKATSSKENITYGLELATSLGFNKVAVATDPFQMIYLNKYINEIAPQMAKMPISMDSLKQWYLAKVSLPEISKDVVFMDNFNPKNGR